MEIKENVVAELKRALSSCTGRIFCVGCGYWGNIIGSWLKKNGLRFKFVDKNGDGVTILRYEDVPCSLSEKGGDVFIIASLYVKDALIASLKSVIGIENFALVTFFDHITLEPLVYEVKFSHNPVYNDVSFFKNKLSGKRLFIIGNGPSLKIKDLDRLQGEITFATNEIYGVYEKTRWWPTFYFIEDVAGACSNLKNSPQFMQNMLKSCKYVCCNIKTPFFESYANFRFDSLFFYKIFEQRFSELSKTIPFSDNIADCVFGVGTTVYSMYQFAAYMGVSEIYLLGMDFNFRHVRSRDGSIQVDKSVTTHADFIPEDPERPSVYDAEAIFLAHEAAKKYADAHGIKIYNATRGGKLEVFPRVDFDSLFGA